MSQSEGNVRQGYRVKQPVDPMGIADLIKMKIRENKKTARGKVNFGWESAEERLKRDMKIPPKKKLEWLREMNEFPAMKQS